MSAGRLPRFESAMMPMLNQIIDDYERRIATLEGKRTTLIEGAIIGTGETEIRHNLGRVPEDVNPVPRSDARVWQPRKATETSLYLRASASVAVDIYLR